MKTIYPFMGLALCSVTAQAQEKPNFLIIQCDHLTQRVVLAIWCFRFTWSSKGKEVI